MSAWVEMAKVEKELNKFKDVTKMTCAELDVEYWKIQHGFEETWTPEEYESQVYALERDTLCSRQRALKDELESRSESISE